MEAMGRTEAWCVICPYAERCDARGGVATQEDDATRPAVLRVKLAETLDISSSPTHVHKRCCAQKHNQDNCDGDSDCCSGGRRCAAHRDGRK